MGQLHDAAWVNYVTRNRAPRVFLNKDDAERPRLICRGYPQRVSARAIAYAACLRKHPYMWLRLDAILIEVEGPTPVTSPKVAARELTELLKISSLAGFLHHEHGGRWCWTPVPPSLWPPNKLV